MIVHMVPGIAPNDPRIMAVREKAERYGLTTDVNIMPGTHFNVVEIRLKDGIKARCGSTPEYPFKNIDGVNRVVRVSPSLVSIAMNGAHEPRHVQIGNTKVGQGLPCLPVIGQCAIDKHVARTVEALADLGVRHMRGGFVKPRSKADGFRGFGGEGLRWFLSAARHNGVESVWCEVMDTANLDDVSRARDRTGYAGNIVVWVGARTGNQVLLERLGIQREFMVMLKNKLHGPIEELLTAADFVLHGPMAWDENGVLDRSQSSASGNDNLILCVRGLEKTDPHGPLRFYSNVDWIHALHQRAWAPVCFDPSHIAGSLKYVPEVLAQGLRFQPDVVMIEAHVNPAQTLCDNDQAVPIERVPEILAMIEEHNRKYYPPAIDI